MPICIPIPEHVIYQTDLRTNLKNLGQVILGRLNFRVGIDIWLEKYFSYDA